MQDYFQRIAKTLDGMLQGGEVYTSSFSGEDSDFVRFNRSEIRQAGTVAQRSITLDLIEGKRHSSGTRTLSGEFDEDRARLSRLVKDLRGMRAHLPEDPHLLYATDATSGSRIAENRLPEPGDAVADIRKAGHGRDLVGIFASGGIHAGFASSFGQRNWYTTYSYNLDWSFYHEKDKAVKTGYTGFEWRQPEFERKVSWAAEQLRALAHPPRTIRPGRHRVYLSPVALGDIFGLLCWGGFGLKAHKTKQTPLLKMVEEGAKLHPSITLLENTREGIAPNFQEAGFLRPDRIPLVREGRYAECLVSPRSAREYGVATNGASAMETPVSLDLSAGGLPLDQVLRRLDTGVYVGNVWYLNYSDRTACRTTGMTRFATFWVENGTIAAPLNVMRFDETIYRMLGENLAGLTAEREMILDPQTYFARSTGSSRMPGALVEDFTFTL